MSEKAFASYTLRASAGAFVALALGFAVIAVCNTVWAIVQNFPILQLWGDDSLFQILLVSVPYLALAAGGVVTRLPWIVGLCLTVAFWGFYLFVITRPYEGGGANIGLALLMMFSPIPILAACVIAARLSAKRKKGVKSGN